MIPGGNAVAFDRIRDDSSANLCCRHSVSTPELKPLADAHIEVVAALQHAML